MMLTKLSVKAPTSVYSCAYFYNAMHPSAEQVSTCEKLFNQYDPQVLNQYKIEQSQGIEQFVLLSYCLACCWPGIYAESSLRMVRQWAELEFNFPSEEAEYYARQNRFYVPGKSVPIDVDVYHKEGGLLSRIFVTIPRIDEGRPVTLGTVDLHGRISGYPDYSWHDNQGYHCDGITSVFRVAIDECSRLWVMDTGKIGNSQVCPPQLLAFDLNNDEIVYRHVVNASNYTPSSLFVTPVVDVKGDCTNTFVYVADVTRQGILIVDVTNHRSRRVSHRLFFPYPSKGSFTVDGESFDLMDGVLGMALSPARGDRDRYLYFHALASTTENIVRTSVLRNNSNMDLSLDPQSVYVFPEERPSQSAAEAMDRDGILYFGLMEPPSIWCWNTATEFSQRNFHQLAIDREALQFASGVKVVKDIKGGQELWILTSSFQRVLTGSLSSNRTNFRIHAEKIPSLIANSPCKKPLKTPHAGYLSNYIHPV